MTSNRSLLPYVMRVVTGADTADEELVKTLFDEHAGPLYGYVLRLTGRFGTSGGRRAGNAAAAWRHPDASAAARLRAWLSTVAVTSSSTSTAPGRGAPAGDRRSRRSPYRLPTTSWSGRSSRGPSPRRWPRCGPSTVRCCWRSTTGEISEGGVGHAGHPAGHGQSRDPYALRALGSRSRSEGWRRDDV